MGDKFIDMYIFISILLISIQNNCSVCVGSQVGDFINIVLNKCFVAKYIIEMLGLLLLFILFILTFYFHKKRYKYWERKGVPQNNVFPPLGDNLEPIVKRLSFGDMILNQYFKFPNSRYSGMYQFNKPVLMIRDPELLKQLCVKDAEYFLDHDFLSGNTDPLWVNSLFALKGQKWKDMRYALSPLFTGSKIRQMFLIMQECAENFAKHFAEKKKEIQEIGIKDVFTRFTNDVITNTTFGIKCDSLKDPNNEFYSKGKLTTNIFGLWKNIKFIMCETFPWLRKIITTVSYDEEVTTFFRKLVQDILEYRQKNNAESYDVVSILSPYIKNNTQKTKMSLELDDVTAQALIFFVAGLETMSIAISFMAYELALNPDIQKRLHEELDEHREKNTSLTYDNAAQLTYLDMVLSETLRKWSPNFAGDRKCVKAFTIEPKLPHEIPVVLSEKDTLWIPIWALHHDPKYWVNPGKFDPERFSPENKEKIVPYSYLPFGMGPRGCIGSRFAILKIKVAFYVLMEYFEFVPIEKTPIPYIPSKTTFNLKLESDFCLGFKKRIR